MVETNRQKFLKKYKLENKSYSISEIAKITGFKKKHIRANKIAWCRCKKIESREREKCEQTWNKTRW